MARNDHASMFSLKECGDAFEHQGLAVGTLGALGMGMTNINEIVTQAIAQSIRQTEIVTLEYDAAPGDKIEAMHVKGELLNACDDWTENGAVSEYWGTDNGREWRVHVRESRSRSVALTRVRATSRDQRGRTDGTWRLPGQTGQGWRNRSRQRRCASG